MDEGPGQALVLIFREIAPDADEAKLARIVAKYNAKYAGRPMREGWFHPVSSMEDAGSFDVIFQD